MQRLSGANARAAELCFVCRSRVQGQVANSVDHGYAMTTNKFIHINPEIESALAARKPIVALESTVIAHGLPQPQNLETAQRLEPIIRDEGAIPATIAVLRGKFCVGLDSS